MTIEYKNGVFVSKLAIDLEEIGRNLSSSIVSHSVDRCAVDFLVYHPKIILINLNIRNFILRADVFCVVFDWLITVIFKKKLFY